MIRIERMAAILLLLQERPYTSAEISRHFEVSRRTILRDVQALCEMGVPVIAREGPGGGYELPAHYHLDPLPLNTSEVFLLLLALNGLKALPALPLRAEMNSLLVKLRALLPGADLAGVERMLSMVRMETPTHAAPAPHLDALFDAVQNKAWVQIVYRSSQRLSTQHILPFEMVIENGFWYCHAYSQEHQGQRTYRADRIQSLAPPATGFQALAIRPERPYDHESHPQIVARLTRRGADLVDSQPHLGPHLHRLEDGAELVLRCPPEELDWYARYFASLGPEIEVLAPPALRSRLLHLGQNLIRKYNSP